MHNRITTAGLLATVMFGSACVSTRILKLENKVLHTENSQLIERVKLLEQDHLDPLNFSKQVDLKVVRNYLDRAGYIYNAAKDGSHIHLEYGGQHTSFGVNIQIFPHANVMFLATSDYLSLSEAQSTPSVILLLTQLAALNYDMLVGKFQLNPQTGEILLSSELHIGDGIGYTTLIATLEHLCQTADSHYADLQRAVSGVGL